MNPDFATIALARYRARQGLKQRYRRAGIKTTGVPYPELRMQTDRYFVEHKEECMAWARGANVKTSVPRKRR